MADSKQHDENALFYSPPCGASDQRNEDYAQAFSAREFFAHLVASTTPVIFDVGAHRGESIKFFKSIYPDASIYSFEPDPQNFDELMTVARQFQTQAIQVALGEQAADQCIYYRQSISHMGGLLPIHTGSSDSLGYAQRATNEEIVVRKTTLDQVFADLAMPRVDILKIDVQGFEKKVLEGGLSMLSKTTCVVVEVQLYDFYGQTNSFPAVAQLMDKAGFSLWDVAKVSKNPKNLRTDWVELVYRSDQP